MPETPTFGRYAEIPYDEMTPAQQEGYRFLVETILQGRQSAELTATRLTELDLPVDWTEQHKLLAG